MLKKKLLLPVLLLLKLKMKALLPIFVGLIGIKAMKALILSKLAIGIVLGFVIYNLVKKTGMPMPMAMTPMGAESPMTAYGAPAPTSSPSSSYENSWEASSNGGPYSRVWEPSPSSSSHNLAYSSYYPSSSSSSSSSNSGTGSAISSHSSYSS